MQNTNSCASCDRTRKITLFGKELQVKDYICSEDGIHYRRKPEDIKLQLSICPTSYCSAHCPFCIAKNTGKKDRIDLKKLEAVLEKLKEEKIVCGVTFTGGEPFTDVGLPDEQRDGKYTILLLDEITSCSKRVQVAAYQLILDRRIGQYTLPDGTFVFALGNREDDDGVYIQLAGPLADRFEIHYIEPDFEGWKYDFALKAGVHPWVVDYLTFKPAALHTQAEEEGSMVFATPRSWVRVSDILNFDSDIYKKVIQYKIVGNVGEAEGYQFVEFCKNVPTL